MQGKYFLSSIDCWTFSCLLALLPNAVPTKINFPSHPTTHIFINILPHYTPWPVPRLLPPLVCRHRKHRSTSHLDARLPLGKHAICNGDVAIFLSRATFHCAGLYSRSNKWYVVSSLVFYNSLSDREVLWDSLNKKCVLYFFLIIYNLVSRKVLFLPM